MNVLFVTWDGGGNVPPALGIAAELQQRGHRVRVMGHPVQHAQVTGMGLDFTAFDTARPFAATDNSTPIDYVGVFGDRGMGRDVVEELRREPAGLVVIDCILFGAMQSVATAGVPYVVLEHMYDAYLVRRWLRGPMGVGMALKRIPARRLLSAAAARLVACSAELDPAGVGPQADNVHYTGPVVVGVPAAPSEPTVLVSLSTVNFPGQARAMQNILDALGLLEVRGMATVGPSIGMESLTAPPNVELRGFVPHAELLPTVSMVIGHGGHATTMAALAHDLPVLVMPMHPMLDQKMVGQSLVDAGAGRLLSKKAKPDAIAAVVTELMGSGPHRAAVARLGAHLRATSGACAGADLVESVSASRTPA
ncbi:UDP:flavonoid glycosyltransferase YjiC (YdhE family) [Nocardioides ginsengisegetis]|uniref:UDP:flavonoid glycosyltransferase YjiC (YdhE family) n=1 Tax=Nocardioides ginsengisegetis TaxID=661491 RepID=A0A7W3IYB0_9ACTN|nr:glycosyltransferase [Nocardioides ginsengisegetis]MBA8802848.1 UDP:flavonoid glycosyltransferase YjiC (YdhE family) [Nocardioides ginsengisegetis]